MDYVTLSHTDLHVSRLCFGTMTFGGQTGEAEAARVLDFSLDAGVNFLDTANVYNKGASEEILGKLLGSRRPKVVLASKVFGKTGDGPDDSGLSRLAIRKALEASLRRLRTDYLDIHYLHQPDYRVPLEETLETMAQTIREGKVRYAAVSNFAGWQICRIHWLCERNGWDAPFISQPMYNLLARGIEQEYLPMSLELGISTIVYNPLAGGLLTGKQPREAPLEGTRFDKNRVYLDRYWHPDFFDAVEALAGIARQFGRSLVSLSLSWLLHHTPVTGLILGASRPEHLRENLAACREGPLPGEAVAACDEVWAKLRGVTPKYNR